MSYLIASSIINIILNFPYFLLFKPEMELAMTW